MRTVYRTAIGVGVLCAGLAGALWVPAARAAGPDRAPSATPLAGKSDLSIGSTAPEIKGKDVNGKPLKLSDYRGKVVVLDFWGDW